MRIAPDVKIIYDSRRDFLEFLDLLHECWVLGNVRYYDAMLRERIER